MHADSRLMLGKLVTLLAAISSARAFYIPGRLPPHVEVITFDSITDLPLGRVVNQKLRRE